MNGLEQRPRYGRQVCPGQVILAGRPANLAAKPRNAARI